MSANLLGENELKVDLIFIFVKIRLALPAFLFYTVYSPCFRVRETSYESCTGTRRESNCVKLFRARETSTKTNARYFSTEIMLGPEVDLKFSGKLSLMVKWCFLFYNPLLTPY